MASPPILIPPALQTPKSLDRLPAFIQHILDHHLEEFISIQWKLSEEIGAPVMKYFSHIPEADRLALSIAPTKEFWGGLASGDIYSYIPALERWKNNQMPLIANDQVVSEDITKGNYVRKLSLMHFLPGYTSDPQLYTELAAEIDYYLHILIQESFNVYIQVQNERFETVNRNLREGTRFAEALIDGSVDTITAYDHDLRLIAINRKAADRFSFVKEEVLGRHMLELFPQADRDFALSNMARVLRGETIRYKSKSIVTDEHFDIHLIPLLNASSEVYGILSVAHDITGIEETNLKVNELGFTLREQNEKLRKSEEQYHKMVAEVQDYAIILLDMDGVIRNWNVGAEKIKGYKAEEIIGSNFRLFYSEADRIAQLPERLLEEAIANGKATHEGWRVRKDGSRFWGSIVITAMHGDDGEVTGFSKVTRDLSERKAAEEALRQQNSLLESANEILQRKNKELKAFNYVASHDLQEPLRKIRTFANLILDPSYTSDEDKKQELLERIISASNNMQTFIEDMLVYSKTNEASAGMERVDLSTVFAAVESELGPFEEKGIRIDADRLPAIHGVRFQMHQLFQNLISNSIKYRHDERSLIIKVRYQRLEGRYLVRPDADPLKSYHLISFEDNGIGFDNDYAEKIFEPFQRLHAKSQYSGSGVGLAICKTIMQNHHGLIYAHGTPNQGSQFYLAFPFDPSFSS